MSDFEVRRQLLESVQAGRSFWKPGRQHYLDSQFGYGRWVGKRDWLREGGSREYAENERNWDE